MPTKSNEKYMSFLHCISSFEGTSYEHLSGKAIRSYFFLFLLAFTSADIIFQKYLESHSEKKKDFQHIFSIFNKFTLAVNLHLEKYVAGLGVLFCYF